eukprot:TRINITY_DN52904_c0_g1_i2.p2 TRINITY_DN52904_c0_g1~~TRINITY_DN52904_c0_g1_i2.p2  ORF type:complete len:135 (+),score=16.39 TRINITY_DN52904_c0_g1_i2:39-443(+)
MVPEVSVLLTKCTCSRISAEFEVFFFFFQAEDGIRDVERSRGLGDVYKRQDCDTGKVISLSRDSGSVLLLQVTVTFPAQLNTAIPHVIPMQLGTRTYISVTSLPFICIFVGIPAILVNKKVIFSAIQLENRANT